MSTRHPDATSTLVDQPAADRIVVVFTVRQWTPDAVHRLRQIADHHPGRSALYMRLLEGGALVPVPDLPVDAASPLLVRRLLSAFGPDAVEGHSPFGGAA